MHKRHQGTLERGLETQQIMFDLEQIQKESVLIQYEEPGMLDKILNINESDMNINRRSKMTSENLQNQTLTFNEFNMMMQEGDEEEIMFKKMSKNNRAQKDNHDSRVDRLGSDPDLSAQFAEKVLGNRTM